MQQQVTRGSFRPSGFSTLSGAVSTANTVHAHGPWDGLIIDDFFALSLECASFLPGSGLSALKAKLRVAKAASASEQLPGADDKNI